MLLRRRRRRLSLTATTGAECSPRVVEFFHFRTVDIFRSPSNFFLDASYAGMHVRHRSLTLDDFSIF